jgi:hypothetical protein
MLLWVMTGEEDLTDVGIIVDGSVLLSRIRYSIFDILAGFQRFVKCWKHIVYLYREVVNRDLELPHLLQLRSQNF